MKKLMIGLLSSILFIPVTYAFSIDVDKIAVNSQGESLKNETEYEIETDDFDKTLVVDEKAVEMAKELAKLTAKEGSVTDKEKEILQYQYFSTTNGFDTLTGNLFIKNYFEELSGHDITYGYIQTIRTVEFLENDVMAFVYISENVVDEEEKDIVLSYWLKKDEEGNYKLYYPWTTIGDDLKNYFDKVSTGEANGEIIGGSAKQVTLDENDEVSDEVLNTIYNNNINSNVQITGLSNSVESVYGSGFVLREGIVVTTWSILAKCLSDSNYVYINDASGNTYAIAGIVAIQADYDVVVLKLDKEALTPIKISQEVVEDGSNIFMINSKENIGFSISYGNYLSEDNGKLQNLLAITDSDVGSALYTENGDVVGFVTGDILYSDLSYANSTSYLKELQDTLSNEEFADIGAVSYDKFKNVYYVDVEEEKTYNNIPDDVWEKFKEIGNIEDVIKLPLLKGNYEDKIISIRYKNDTLNMIDTMYYVSEYIDNLEDEGYQITYNSSKKKILENSKYEIIIKEDLNYLIILFMEK